MQATIKKNSAPVRRLSILVADDDVDTVLTLATMLRDDGHIVHTCANANIVIEAVERYQPDVCILDIVMPGKTGFSIARDLLGMKLAKRPILIALTGVFTKASDEVVARTAGFDYFVRKGGEPNELLGLIAELAGADTPPAA
jgi:two-component system OmpR family response regulator